MYAIRSYYAVYGNHSLPESEFYFEFPEKPQSPLDTGSHILPHIHFALSLHTHSGGDRLTEGYGRSVVSDSQEHPFLQAAAHPALLFFLPLP